MDGRLNRRKPHDKFIEDAKRVHNDLDYSKTNYINCRTKVIVGNKYGYCSIRPDSFLSGVNLTIRNAIDKNSYWINMVKEVHGDLDLDYSKVNYINNYTKVIIGTKYGDCLLTPSNVLNGSKFNILSAVNKTEYWKNMAIEIHGNKYDYSKVVYTGNACMVTIICPIHGEFIQNSCIHTQGGGCLRCSREESDGGFNPTIAERKKYEWLNKSAKVYTIKCWNDEEEFYKIGITTTSIKTRFKNSYMPYNYEVVDIIETNLYDAVYLERKMHGENKNSYIPKIYFKGYTECFGSL